MSGSRLPAKICFLQRLLNKLWRLGKKKKKFSSLSKLNAFPRGKKKSNLGPICDPIGVSPRRSLAQRAQR